MDAMDIRDKDHAKRLDQLEMSNEGHISRIDTTMESLLQLATKI